MFEELGAPDAFARLSAESLDRAARYDWPGNVRELRNVISLSLAYDTGGPVDLGVHLGSRHTPVGPGSVPLVPNQTFAEARLDLERRYFIQLHAECAGNVSEMARRAEVDRKTVRECLRRHRIGN